MGIGIASGDSRALEAAEQAINSSLLETSIAGASRILFSIAGGPELALSEVDEAARVVEAVADENANIITARSLILSWVTPFALLLLQQDLKQPATKLQWISPVVTICSLLLRSKQLLRQSQHKASVRCILRSHVLPTKTTFLIS